MDIEQTILKVAEELSPSEIHVRGGMPVYARVMGELKKVAPAPSVDESRDFLQRVVEETRLSEYTRDTEFRWRNFRVGIYRERGKVSLVFRGFKEIPLLETLGQVDILEKYVNEQSGIIVIASGICEGKTTTAFSFMNEIMLNRTVHITTLEDPVEYILPHDAGIVTQRSKFKDFKSAGASVYHAMRTDVDVLFMSNVYCTEDVESCIDMAEAGRLVIIGVRARSVLNTLQKLTELTSSRTRLAGVLKLIIAQELCVKNDKLSSVAEILTSTAEVKKIIAEGNLEDVIPVMQKGKDNMQTLEMAIKKM